MSMTTWVLNDLACHNINDQSLLVSSVVGRQKSVQFGMAQATRRTARIQGARPRKRTHRLCAQQRDRLAAARSADQDMATRVE